MKCDRCGDEIPNKEENAHHSRTLCEDCFMDALSPARTCDPWAVRSAGITADSGSPDLTITQKSILAILKETGGTGLTELGEKLNLKVTDLDREIAALRHMEKIRGTLKDGKKIFLPW